MSRGGHNRTHGSVERFRRLDSFTDSGGDFEVERVPNHYGGERPFFLCPRCSRRVRFLYPARGLWLCRTCGRLNYASQQNNRDELAPYWKAVKLLRATFRLTDIPVPMDLPYCVPPRPKGMHMTTYLRHMRKLEGLKREYLASFLARAKVILGW